MSSGNDFARFLLDAVRKGASSRVDDAFVEGFEEAANICIGVLSKNIDGLLNQIKSGSYLSDQEQFMLSKLDEIKSETEKDLCDFWGNVAAGKGRS